MGLKILIIPGLTLTEIPEQSVETMKTIAGADSEVVICEHANAHNHIVDADIVLGIVTPKLFSSAKSFDGFNPESTHLCIPNSSTATFCLQARKVWWVSI